MHLISRTLCASVVVLLTLLSTAEILEPDIERFTKVRRMDSFPRNVHKEVFGAGAVSEDSEANDTESDGSESNDIGDDPELDDPGSESDETELDDTKESRKTESDAESEEDDTKESRQTESDVKSEKDDTKESRQTESDVVSEEEEDDGGAKKFFYNLYYNMLTGIFHDLGVILKFFYKSVSIIKNFFEELWVKIKRKVKQFVKETLEKINKLLKAIWEKISQEYYPIVLDFVGVWSLEIFLVIAIVSVWSCFFNHYVIKKHKMKKKKRKEKEKATIFANACAGLVELDLENGSSYLSNEELAGLGSRTGDEIVGAEEGGSIIETIPEEEEEESTECSTSISTEDDTSTLVTSNASAQV